MGYCFLLRLLILAQVRLLPSRQPITEGIGRARNVPGVTLAALFVHPLAPTLPCRSLALQIHVLVCLRMSRRLLPSTSKLLLCLRKRAPLHHAFLQRGLNTCMRAQRCLARASALSRRYMLAMRAYLCHVLNLSMLGVYLVQCMHAVLPKCSVLSASRLWTALIWKQGRG